MDTANRRERGFTLLEMLVVLAIMGLLAAVIGPQVIKYLGSSRSQTAKIQVKNVAAALELYRLDAGRYPTREEGLAALVNAPTANNGVWNGPYLPQSSAITDPWGNAYRFEVPGKHGEIDVYSYGSDNAEGGDGEARDVGSW